MSEPVVIRASSLSSYADCPRRAAARLFKDDVLAAGFALRELPNGIGAAVGTAVHRAAAVMLDEKARTGVLPPADIATDAAIDSLREAAAGGMTYDRESPGLNDAEQQSARMVRAYRSAVAPDIQPLIVEERIEAEVTPTLTLSGQADVIAREPGRVIDLKTGKRLGNHNGQIGAYSLLARSIGLEVKEATIDFIQRVPVKKPQPDPVRQRHDILQVETAAANILRTMEADLRMFREGDFGRRLSPGDPWSFLANPSSKLCSAKWCPAHGTDFCHEHAKEEEE